MESERRECSDARPPSAGVGLQEEPGVVSAFEQIDYREASARSAPKQEGVLAVAGDFEVPTALPVNTHGQNMMSWCYLVPTGLPGPESSDLPIVDEDLVPTEPVAPPGRSTMDHNVSHVRIIGR